MSKDDVVVELKSFLDGLSSKSKTDVRLVEERGPERRQDVVSFGDSCRRQDIRRDNDKRKLEQQIARTDEYKRENERLRAKNASLRVPSAEVALWCGAMFVGIVTLFGWNILLYTL